MVKPRSFTTVDCPQCGKTIGRKADLPRHVMTHATNKEEFMHACPYTGCRYKTLQRSNLMTHMNVHTHEKPNKCPEDGCAFSTADPGSLTRHRQKRHGYNPKAILTGNHASATGRKVARQRRRNVPYARSFTTTGSSSPSDQSSPSSLPLVDDHVEEGSKNNSAAYGTELTTTLAQTSESHVERSTQTEDTPLLYSEPLTASEAPVAEAPVAEQPQLTAPEQEEPYPAVPVATSISELPISDEILDNFLAKFKDCPITTSLPQPTIPYSIDPVSVSVPTPITLPPYAVNNASSTSAVLPSCQDQYIINNILKPSAASLPPYEVHHPVDIAPYEYYGYPAAGVPFNTQFSFPISFAPLDMDAYPQAYTSHAHARTSGFAVPRFCMN